MLVLSSSWLFLLISSDEQLSNFVINTKWMQKHSELKLLQNFQKFEKFNVLIVQTCLSFGKFSTLLLESTTWERL
jgi:hypothetical protein